MLCVMDEVYKRTNNNIDPNQWAKLPFSDKYDAVEVPTPSWPNESEEQEKYREIGTFELIALMAPILALAIVPVIISTVAFKKLSI